MLPSSARAAADLVADAATSGGDDVEVVADGNAVGCEAANGPAADCAGGESVGATLGARSHPPTSNAHRSAATTRQAMCLGPGRSTLQVYRLPALSCK